MIRKAIPLFIALLLLVAILAACATSNHAPRKCDGRKGQKTPMGTI